MDKLLSAVLDAHGGSQQWSRTAKVTARMSLGGPFWAARGWEGAYSKLAVTLDPHREHITLDRSDVEGHIATLDIAPERISITSRGRLVEERLAPRDSFPGPFDPTTTRWDAIQVAYFTSAAIWNYLTAPFVFAQAGVVAREIEPWVEGEQTWRRLAVIFPETNANHNAEQVFYYDAAFMQRRMDYSPDVTGNPPVAHYSHDHKAFDGFVFPTRRLVHLHDARGIADQTFAPITIDVAEVTVEHR